MALIAVPAGPVVAATPTTYTVTSAGDEGDGATRDNCATGTGPCTLRAALLEADAHPNDPSGVDAIQFAIPGTAPHVIAPTSSLPLITDPVTVDAGLPAAGAPRSVEVTGHNCNAGLPSACEGLVTRVGATTIRGLAVNGFFHGFRAVSPGFVPLTGVVLEGNYFGTDATGTTLVGPPEGTFDDGRGILLSRVNASRIGGDPDLGAGNLVAGYRVRQVEIEIASQVQVLGNLIGVEPDGATPLPTTTSAGGGISLGTGSGNVVGAPGSGNVVSGLAGTAVAVNAATGTRIQGNRIGTDAAGAKPVPNRGIGVDIQASTDTTIGGSPAAGNVLSANSTGLSLSDGPAGGGGEVSYNHIGTDLTGLTALGNGSGVQILGRNYYLHHNLISGNGKTAADGAGSGVEFPVDGSTGNRLEDNQIGVGADGRALGNAGYGIEARYDPFVGGSTSIGAVGAGNEIAYNGSAGVLVTGQAGQVPDLSGVTIRGNSIHDNGGRANASGLGIDLLSNTDVGQGPDEIDPLDADDGANTRQNAPEILGAVTDTTGADVSLRLRSVPGAHFTVDLYANPACDPSGSGEGQTWLSQQEVTTAPTGDPEAGTVRFTMTVSRSVVAAGLAATATDDHADTSEFSACLRAPSVGTATTYTGPTTATYSDPLQMSGRLTDATTQPPTGIPGAQLDFTLGDQDPVHASPTDQNGNITAAPTAVTTAPGVVDVVTRFPGDATHVGSNDRDPVTINKEDCSLAYTGDTLVPALTSTRLAAQFSEPDAYPGDWSGKGVTFLVTTTAGATTEYTAATNGAGLAEVAVPLNADVYAVNVRFAGDRFYKPCSTSIDTLVTVSAAAAKVTGGGWISNSVGRTSFGLNAIPQTDGAFKGQFQLRSNSDKSKFHGPVVTALSVLSPNSVTWMGTGRWNGTSGYSFRVTVVDNGSSGSQKGDTIDIRIYRTGDPTHPVFTTGSPQLLKGGNITVH